MQADQEKGISPDPWLDSPDLIRQFIELRPNYEQLCNEVEYILQRRLSNSKIEFASVTSRVKKLTSFLEKIDRKKYCNPLEEITDFAGIRVVSLYQRDLQRIEEVIRKEFDVIEKVDKRDEKDVDQFGYGAVHFIAVLGKSSTGARYDELKDFKFEIQTRTVLQDAWAIIQHHLVYKNESDIPKALQRKLYGLAGLIETADDQFQAVFDMRMEYLEEVRKLQPDPVAFLQTEINVDSVSEFLRWKFPGRAMERKPGSINSFNSCIDRKKYKTLADLNSLIDSSEEARKSFPRREWGITGESSACGELNIALLYLDDEFFASNKFSGEKQILAQSWRSNARKENPTQ